MSKKVKKALFFMVFIVAKICKRWFVVAILVFNIYGIFFKLLHSWFAVKFNNQNSIFFALLPGLVVYLLICFGYFIKLVNLQLFLNCCSCHSKLLFFKWIVLAMVVRRDCEFLNINLGIGFVISQDLLNSLNPARPQCLSFPGFPGDQYLV